MEIFAAALVFSAILLAGTLWALARTPSTSRRLAAPRQPAADEGSLGDRVARLERALPEWQLAMENLAAEAQEMLGAAERKRRAAKQAERRAGLREDEPGGLESDGPVPGVVPIRRGSVMEKLG